jgi:hypothetical protein
MEMSQRSTTSPTTVIINGDMDLFTGKPERVDKDGDCFFTEPLGLLFRRLLLGVRLLCHRGEAPDAGAYDPGRFADGSAARLILVKLGEALSWALSGATVALPAGLVTVLIVLLLSTRAGAARLPGAVELPYDRGAIAQPGWIFDTIEKCTRRCGDSGACFLGLPKAAATALRCVKVKDAQVDAVHDNERRTDTAVAAVAE